MNRRSLQHTFTLTLILTLTLLLCGGGILGIVWWSPVDAPTVPAAPRLPRSVFPASTAAQQQAQRDAFYRTRVTPLLTTVDQHNRAAADRCLERLQATFDGYRNGVPGFARDVNSWSTRWGVIRRTPGDWWHDQAAVRDYVAAKFARHVFTDRQLHTDIEAALATFRDEVRAHQNGLIIDIQAAISATDLPGLADIDYAPFAADLQKRLNAYAEQAAQQSLGHFVIVEILAGVGGYAAQQLLVQLTTRLATLAAANTTAAGGATATGAVVGGGGGSFAGPIGAVAGFVVGLVMGGLLDWWMSQQFENKMVAQLNHTIDHLSREVIHGTPAQPGLRSGLAGACDSLQQAYRETLRTRIVAGGVQ